MRKIIAFTMENPVQMPHDDWTQCPDCHYPLLKLKDFEGVSSRDAIDIGTKDAHDYWVWGLWAIVYDILGEVWNGLRSFGRRRKVQKLRAELLEQYPNTLICPQCLKTVKKS